jgi:hypothetical protein
MTKLKSISRCAIDFEVFPSTRRINYDSSRFSHVFPSVKTITRFDSKFSSLVDGAEVKRQLLQRIVARRRARLS